MGLYSKRSKKDRSKDVDMEGLDDSEDEELLVNGEEVEEISEVEEEDTEEEDEDIDDGEEEEVKDGEMEELEKEYKELHNKEQDMLRNLKHHKHEDVKKGQAVKNQKALWDKALEFRFLLQKAFSGSNRLPHALLENNPSIAESLEGNGAQPSKKLSGDSMNLDMEDDGEWLQISQMNRRIVAFRNKAVDKWQRKTEVTTGAAAIKNKLQAFNQNISEQVAAYMRDPTRMIKQMQQRRSTIGIFGAVIDSSSNANGEEAHPKVIPNFWMILNFTSSC